MAYEYDNDNGFRPERPQPPKKDNDIGAWIFIAVMFTVAWPIGLILLLINLFLIFVGMFMETIAAILILFPTLLAVAAAVGVDPIHFGIIVVMNLVLGLCTPPVGVCLFAATNIGSRYGKCTLSDSVKALVPLLIVNFGVLFLVTYVPFLTVGVANLVMG